MSGSSNVARALQIYGYDPSAGLSTLRSKGVVTRNTFSQFTSAPIYLDNPAIANATDIARDVQIFGNMATGLLDANMTKYVEYTDEDQIPSQQALPVGEGPTFGVTAALANPSMVAASDNLGGSINDVGAFQWECRYPGVYELNGAFALVTPPAGDVDVKFQIEESTVEIWSEVNQVLTTHAVGAVYRVGGTFRLEEGDLIRIRTSGGDGTCQMALARFTAKFISDDPFTL